MLHQCDKGVKLSGQSTTQPNRNPPPTHTNMTTDHQTIANLARLASVAVNDAENALHRAERALEAARKVKEITDALYEAAITEQATALAARLAK